MRFPRFIILEMYNCYLLNNSDVKCQNLVQLLGDADADLDFFAVLEVVELSAVKFRSYHRSSREFFAVFAEIGVHLSVPGKRLADFVQLRSQSVHIVHCGILAHTDGKCLTLPNHNGVISERTLHGIKGKTVDFRDVSNLRCKIRLVDMLLRAVVVLNRVYLDA